MTAVMIQRLTPKAGPRIAYSVPVMSVLAVNFEKVSLIRPTIPSGMNMTAAKARFVSQALRNILDGGGRQALPAYQQTAHLMEG